MNLLQVKHVLIVATGIAALFVVPLWGQAEPAPGHPEGRKIPALLAGAGCGTFAKVIAAAGMTGTLEGRGPFTCFAPLDSAFAGIPAEQMQKYLDPARSAENARWISYLVIETDLDRETLERSRRVPTLSGDFVTLWINKGRVHLDNHSTIRRADLKAANGVIHTVDRLPLLPTQAGKKP